MKPDCVVSCPAAPVPPPGDIGELLNLYEQCWSRVRGLSPGVFSQHRTCLKRFFEANSIGSSEQLLRWLSPSRLVSFSLLYARDHGYGSQLDMQKSLRSFLRFCRHQGYIAEDLSEAVPSRRRWRLDSVPRALPENCIERLLAGIDRGRPPGCRDAAVAILADTYGVRNVQLRRLRLEDIDWDGELICFPAAKGGAPVRVPLTAEAGSAVLDYLEKERPADSPHAEVFLQAVPPFGPFIWSGSFAKIVTRRLRELGIEPPEGVSRGLHGFRHAFASRLTGHVPLKHISDLLGHRDLDSTLIYTMVDFEGLAGTALRWPEEVTP